MAKEVKQAHGGSLKILEKGETANPNGRPRKYTTMLKSQGYKLSEINDSIQVMLSMTIEELADVWNSPNATILEKTIANALRKSIDRGSLYSIDTLLSRVYGKPKESISQEVTINSVSVEIIHSDIPLASSESEIK